jgi:hypothetical protein
MSGAIYNLNPTQQQQSPQSRGAKTTAAVSVTTTASVALAANANRANWSFYNAGPATVFMREGTTVTAALYEKPIPAGFHWDSDPSTYRYTGAIALITQSGRANVMVSESVLA